MGDDAVGPYVVKFLEAEYTFPEHVQVVEIGTPGLDMIPYVTGVDILIVIDSVKSDGPAGTIKVYYKDQILEHVPQVRLGPHDPTLKEALLTAEFAGGAPREVVLVGVVPGPVRTEPGLCDAVKGAVVGLLQTVVDELEKIGVHPMRRDPADKPDLWWER